MKKAILLIVALMFVCTISKAQTTAIQINGLDCNGVSHDLFADLDAGKVAILHFFMPNCGSCPPPAQKIQTMANHILATHPGMITGYAMPFQNSTTCIYTSDWVSSNGLLLYAPYDKGAAQVAYYGGFGMPTVVLLGGKDHKILFSTLSFSTSDTTIMRDKILEILGTTKVEELPNSVNSFSISPNPATDNATINIELKEKSRLKLDVTDISGKQVAVIIDGIQFGIITNQFNTQSLPTGNYLVRLQVNGKTFSKELSIIH